MSHTIEELQEQILNFQKTLDQLKNPKMEIIRQFTGQYFAPYEGRQYRRMESEGIPIWECFLYIKQEWTILSSQESEKLENVYLKDCIQPQKPSRSTKSTKQKEEIEE